MFIYQVVFCLSRLFAAVGIVSPVSIPAIAPHSLHIRPFFYSVIPASEPGSWAALCEVLHCAVALPSSSSPAPPRVRLRANWAAVRQSVQARLHSPCTNCPHQVRDDGAIAPLYHCLRHCHPRQRLPGCRLGGRHGGAVAPFVLSASLETLHAASLPCVVNHLPHLRACSVPRLRIMRRHRRPWPHRHWLLRPRLRGWPARPRSA